ncbi:hypothetical protein [Ornithinibacillus xuwenensis]|uniref:Uncharacterized protein n=1 Tax=Ornithinibacillus xuwenensis TaxID=3144668 RepID=A0ABU9XHT9_9BACI
MSKVIIRYGVALLVSLFLYLLLSPWEFPNLITHFCVFLLVLFFPLILVFLHAKNQWKAFWLTFGFSSIGAIRLLVGLIYKDKISIIDSIRVNKDNLIIVDGNRMLIGEPISYWYLEGLLIYLFFGILGILVGIIVQRKSQK